MKIYLCAFIIFFAFAGGTNATAQTGKKVLTAGAADAKITIDGKLDEPAWARADIATGFAQNAPNPGDPSRRRTEVRVLYDNEAVYIGAQLFDERDSVLHQLSPRDVFGDQSTDAFGVIFDTYNDKQNASNFGVTAAGVQLDAIIKFDGVNYAWNSAWYSKTQINDSGWSVEMKIPYAALRFPNSREQEWGINFCRVIRRYRETSYWNAVLPTIPNALSQSGKLTGVHDIQSPVRLSFLPYVSAYAENYSGITTKTLNGGMDVKYGFNESFTLDLTLVPDFGQTIYDNRVLNLSPVEVRYDERRYFFTEGLDLFNKNDLFYSRRVGGPPINAGAPVGLFIGDTIIKSPATTRLYNATKISGRTKGNLGIGFFNAISAPAEATVRDSSGAERKLQTSPLTNYNVIVLDQALRGNSYVSLINTNVTRQENSYNANVSALLFRLVNKKNSYGLDGSGDVSQLWYTARPDVGYRYFFDLGKISGNYTWRFSTRTISDHFNPNDLGYLDHNNLSYYSFENYYNTFKPNRWFNESYNHIGIEYFRVFNPDVFRAFDIYGSHNITFKSFLTSGFYWSVDPVPSYDYYEPRTLGRYYVLPENYMFGAFYSTDYRKRFAFDLSFSERWFAAPGRNEFSWNFSPRYRFSNKFSMIYSLSGYTATRNVGYVANVSDSIYFGTRNVNTVTNSLDAAYIFSNTMSLKIDARHYWSQANYSDYHLLNTDGSLATTGYNAQHNVNYNSFNIYTSLVWQFRPGSEMSVVYQNSIYSSPDNPAIESNYFADINTTFKAPQSNSLSLKVIYYLDYLALRKVVKGS